MMQLSRIHLDDALFGQPRFSRACAEHGAIEIDVRNIAPGLRLWSDARNYSALRALFADRLPGPGGSTPVTWMGSGDFHHVTGVLTALRAEALGEAVTIVHFDNHPDWVSFSEGVHCGSWVRHVLETGVAKRVISLALTSRDLSWPEFKGAGLEHVESGRLVLFPLAPPPTTVFRNYGSGPAHDQHGRRIEWQRFAPEDVDGLGSRILALIGSGPVYLSIDKDVLCAEAACTNWDQGALKLDHLINWIDLLVRHTRVVGIDVIGDYSEPAYGPNGWARLLKRAEAMLDQPWSAPPAAGVDVNERTNLVLLTKLARLLC